MNYEAMTQAIVDAATADRTVLGLVLCGSTAARSRRPDPHSDHDFWVITEPGAQPRLRRDSGWLPDADRIVLHFVETEHGCKVVYEHGHLLEYAVFDLEELRLARVNEYRVAIDRGGIAEAMAAVRAVTEAERAAPSDAWRVGQLLTNLLVGAGRARRGELFSAHHLVKGAAADRLVELWTTHLKPTRASAMDDLDPRRRIEQTFPEPAQRLASAMQLEPEAAAQALLTLAEDTLAGRIEAWPSAAEQALRRRLDTR